MEKTKKDLTVERNATEGTVTIRFSKTLRRNIKTSSFVIVAEESLPQLISVLKDYLTTYEFKEVSTKSDKLKISGGGTDMSPEIMISSKYTRRDGTLEGHTIFIPEKSGAVVVKALKKILQQEKH